jgi:anionic cell wall polymer biosynthesis LytR-Cps2A-Psr (LCP) family protein
MRGERAAVCRVLALTLGSAILWGLAHLIAGRTRAGLALATLYVLLLGTVMTAVTALRPALFRLLVQPEWLGRLIIAALCVAVLWSAVVVRSYMLVRPAELSAGGRRLTKGVVALACVALIAPLAVASRIAYVSRDVLTALFASGQEDGLWGARTRLNVLLVGADAARNRPGARTDSLTLASVDTHTGQTVLFGLPRNLEHVPLPAGPARDMFPWGFQGGGTTTPGLLNEVYEWGADHPETGPGLEPHDRGIALLKGTVSEILGIPVDYYAMVDMRGFRQVIDAMGGVRVTIRQDIPYGLEGGVLVAGTRLLDGEQALWFGRSRTGADDYVRMARQKCLINDVAKQADAMTVLQGFERLADAAKRYVRTDLPQRQLPALVELAEKVRGTEIRSLSFVPPLINTADPDWWLIRKRVAQALSGRSRPHASRTPAPSPSPATTPATTPQPLDAIC